jgi:hypothetical protein
LRIGKQSETARQRNDSWLGAGFSDFYSPNQMKVRDLIALLLKQNGWIME